MTGLQGTQRYRSLDLLFTIVPRISIQFLCNDDGRQTSIRGSGRVALDKLIRTCFGDTASNMNREYAAKLLLVPYSGYLCRANISPSRMKASGQIESIVNFAVPDDRFMTAASPEGTSLLAAILSSPGALVARASKEMTLDILQELEIHLQRRFNFDWVLTDQLASRHVAVIGSVPMFGAEEGSFGSRGPLEAVEILGLLLTVIDRPDHWLKGDEWSHLRHDFLPVDMNNDPRLSYRIASSLEGVGVDGVVTFSPDLVLTAANVARMLGLPSESPSALSRTYRQCDTITSYLAHNRAESLPSLGLACSTNEDLRTRSMSPYHQDLAGYLVSTQTSSVYTVGCLSSDEFDAYSISTTGKTLPGTGVTANDSTMDIVFVLCKGNVLFSSISKTLSFQEAVQDHGDPRQCDSWKRQLGPSFFATFGNSIALHLLVLGFESGIFRVRAGVHRSAKRKREDAANSTIGDSATSDVQIFISAVEAQPPSLHCDFQTLQIDAVVFCTLHILRCLDDDQGLARVSQSLCEA